MRRSLDSPSRFSKRALKCCLSRTVPAHPARISQRKLKCDSPRADGCAASWWLKVADPLIWTSRHWLWREQLASPMCRRNCAPVISQFAFQWYFAPHANGISRGTLTRITPRSSQGDHILPPLASSRSLGILSLPWHPLPPL